MSEYHEKWEALPAETRDRHRALKSLQEEIEAVDWYEQRLAVTEDEELRSLLEHNRDEEIEHSAMLLEWLCRHMDGWDEKLRAYLHTTGAIKKLGEAAHRLELELGIGDMKGEI